MDNYLKVKNSMLSFELEQLGGKIHNANGIICYVDFDINSTKIKYMYHIDKNNKYFLERISPYNVAINEFDNEQYVVNAIKIEIDKFKNATNSNKFKKFIDTNKEFSNIVKSFEDLYLHYNISKYDLQEIQNNVLNIKKKLEEISVNNEIVYTK